MIAIMWQFDVKKGREGEFEQLYGVDGEWTAMNRHTRSYLGSSFLRDQNRSARYIVIEYWSEMVVYERHRAYRADAIASLEARRTALVECVEPLGIFTALDVPDRAGPTWSQRDGSYGPAHRNRSRIEPSSRLAEVIGPARVVSSRSDKEKIWPMVADSSCTFCSRGCEELAGRH